MKAHDGPREHSGNQKPMTLMLKMLRTSIGGCRKRNKSGRRKECSFQAKDHKYLGAFHGAATPMSRDASRSKDKSFRRESKGLWSRGKNLLGKDLKDSVKEAPKPGNISTINATNHCSMMGRRY